jgi:hypothetical protein
MLFLLLRRRFLLTQLLFSSLIIQTAPLSFATGLVFLASSLVAAPPLLIGPAHFLFAEPPLLPCHHCYLPCCHFIIWKACSLQGITFFLVLFVAAVSELILVGVGELVTLLLIEIETWCEVFSQDSIDGLCRVFSNFLYSLAVAWSNFLPCLMYFILLLLCYFSRVKGFSWPRRGVIFSFVLCLMCQFWANFLV